MVFDRLGTQNNSRAMKLLFVFLVCFSSVYELNGVEDLGESPLFDYGADLKDGSDIEENPEMLQEDESPLSQALPEDFQVKEDQGTNLNPQELHEVFGEEFETGLPSEESEDGNNTSSDVALSTEDSSGNSSSILVACATGKQDGGAAVELVNSTRLMNILVTESNITSRRITADCVAVFFYARYCPFSCMAAPHFNALPRAFPDIKMVAVDAMKHPSFNTQYGIVGVPTVMLFHNGRPAAKFNDSEYTLEYFARFINKYTGMEAQRKLYVTSADFGGPVPSVPVKETDFCLALSWIFILICAVYFFSTSSWWQWLIEGVQTTWREAAAQHEHAD